MSGKATQVDLGTSNGAIEATVEPTSSGRFSLATSNGPVTLRVPEDPSRGYDATGTTSNGEVAIQLRDGQKGDCPQGSQYYTPPCVHRTFRTSGFGGRSIQTLVTLATSNGDVTLAPS